MSLTKEMGLALKDEAKKRKLSTMQETMRAILGEYFMLRKEREPDEKSTKKKPVVKKIENTNPLAH